MVDDFKSVMVKLILKLNFIMVPGCEAYAEGWAAYARYVQHTLIGVVDMLKDVPWFFGCAVYMCHCQNKINSVQLSWRSHMLWDVQHMLRYVQYILSVAININKT